MKKIDLTGQRFGRLVVLGDDGTRNNRGKIKWLCQCDCGTILYVHRSSLRSGNTKSCGCLFKEKLIKRNTTHGLYRGNNVTNIQGTPLGNTWILMIQRCYNPNATGFERYGGRGIEVCLKWLGEGGFEQFCNDMGPRPEGKTLDRTNNNDNYKPTNCRWATITEQQNNRRK